MTPCLSCQTYRELHLFYRGLTLEFMREREQHAQAFSRYKDFEDKRHADYLEDCKLQDQNRAWAIKCSKPYVRSEFMQRQMEGIWFDQRMQRITFRLSKLQF